MTTLLILIVIVVVFSYYGGKNVPSLLRNNKEILLGLLVGYCLCFFTGDLIEGNNHLAVGSHVPHLNNDLPCDDDNSCGTNEICLKRIGLTSGFCRPRN